MSKRSKIVWIVILAAVVVAAIWLGGASLMQFARKMHGH